MSLYRVELHGESREVYIVEAESEADARENWHEGWLEVSECYGMDVESVRLCDDDE